MRKRLIVATVLAIAAIAFATTTTPVDGVFGAQLQARPLIVSAELRGNNLILDGFNFDDNAIVYINNKEQNTITDPDSHGTFLKAKKGGKRIRIDESSAVQVFNGDGQSSNVVRLFRTDEFVARLIQFPLQPELGLIHLEVGGYLLIDSRAALSFDGFERDFLVRSGDQRFSGNDLRLYQVLREGDTAFVIAQIGFPNGGPQPPPIVWGLAIHAK